MTVKVSKPAQILALQAHASFLDGGSGSAYFVYYSNTKPSSLEISADPSSSICTLALPKPCTKQMLIDGIELYPTETALATKAGVVTWARLYNGNNEPYADFSIGTSDADIVLNSADIALGSSQKIDSIFLKII